MPIYHLLHGLSSVVGLAILIIWLRHLHRQPARSRIRPYDISGSARIRATTFLIAVSLAGALLEWLPNVHRRYDVQFFTAAVGLMSGLFVGWCGVAIWMRARAGTKKR